MAEAEYVTLTDVTVLRESEKAFLLQLNDGQEVWIPYSQCVDDPDDYKAGDTKCDISITAWIAKQKGLA